MTRTTRSLRTLAALVISWCLACGTQEPRVGLAVIADPSFELIQLRISAEVDGEELPPRLVPDPARPLGALEEVDILLSDALVGRTLVLRIEGMAEDGLRAYASVEIEVGALTDRLEVVLDAPPAQVPGGPGDEGETPSPPPTCDQSCTESSCEFGCVDCSCDLSCSEGQGACSSKCEGTADCAVSCVGRDSCKIECKNASFCDLDCRGSDKCEASCRNDSQCFVDCRGSRECRRIRCEQNAECLIQCDPPAEDDEDERPCGFDVCSRGAPSSCFGNVVVCNRDCP